MVWTLHAAALGSTHGQGWRQIGELGLAFVLSAAIGLEREWRQKSAGLRTHTLVGVGAALFLLVSKYGFEDVAQGNIAFDPSRVAAQVVSGIGFIGGGLIFVRGDIVRGLTTAAIVWVTAAIGMACGAGLWLLAVTVAAAHFAVVLGLTRLSDLIPRSRFAPEALRVVYADGRGALRRVLAECTDRGWSISSVATDRLSRRVDGASAVAVTLELHGREAVDELLVALDSVPDVFEVAASGGDDGE